MSNFTLSLSAAALAAAFLSNSGFAQSAQFIPIPGAASMPGSNPNFCGFSGNTGYSAVRVSADGSTVATVVYDPGFANGAVPRRAARWTETSGTVVLTPELQGLYPCTGISADGRTIYGESWRWTATGGYEDLAPLLGSERTIFGCSDDGQTITGTQGIYGLAAEIDLFRWNLNGGVPQILPRAAGIPEGYFYFNSISGDGSVVGGSTLRPGGVFQLSAAARIDANGVQLLTQETSQEGVSDLSFDGRVAVGYTQENGFQSRAFRWEAATGTVFIDNVVGSNSAYARAVDADGDVIVGDYLNFGTPGTRAFVWRQGLGFFDLQDELEGNYGLAQQLAGWKLEVAIDVSADGRTIVGSALNPQGCNQAFLVRLFEGVTSYCTSATSSAGCVATLVEEGAPSASANSGFNLRLVSADAQRQGLIFYGVSGRTALPWASGSSSTMCVKSPTQRMTLSNTAGALGTCNGSFATDWLAYLASSSSALAAPATPGQLVQAQAWYRDPPAPKSTNLSNALEFTVLP
jgi:uncharacterized membrane protein